MHLTCGRALATTAVLISALSLRGQSTPPSVQPYTVEFEITTTQTSGDVIVTQTDKEIVMRDSQGRTREEWTRFHPADQPAVTTVIIEDRAENTRLAWNSSSRIASAIKLPPPLEERKGCWSSDAGDFHMIHYDPAPGPPPPPSPNLKEENLGTQMIMGIEAHGRRTVQQIPVGQIGNDQPLVKIVESWSAPGLGLTLRQMRDDGRGTRSSMEVVRLDLNEPNPSEFQVPADKDPVPSGMHQYPCPGH
jgi:hypothetical protein